MNKYKLWLKHVYELRETYEFSKDNDIQQFRNELGLLHRDGAPAYISPTVVAHYQNGRRHGITADIWGSVQHYFNNVLIPARYITNPETLTLEEILKNNNAEVRAVGIRIYGFDRLLQEEKFHVVEINKSTGFMLLRWSYPNNPDEDFCLVRVLNSTPEEDGTKKVYYLTVPPNMRTIKEAIAWTFYKTADDYAPAQET